MSNEWYYTKSGEKLGPVGDAELKRLAATGLLLRDDLIWKAGMAKWVEANNAKNLTFVTHVAPPIPAPNPAAVTSAPPPVPSTQLWKSIIAKVKPTVVYVSHSLGLGSGVVVSDTGLILTNRHVIENNSFVNLAYSDHTICKGAVIDISTDDDLAIVQSSHVSSQYLNTAVEPSEAVEEGDEVIAIGHPHGNKFSVTRGIVSSTSRNVNNKRFIQHDVAINPGNSGGPLMDTHGNLIGLNTFGRLESNGLGFAIPSERIRSYVSQVIGSIKAGSTVLKLKAEIIEACTELKPSDALKCAIQMLENIEVKPGDHDQYTLSMGRDINAFVVLNDQLLICRSYVCRLDHQRLPASKLLLELLQINHSFIQARFCIDKDLNLTISAERIVRGMDAHEAFSLLQEVAVIAAKYTDNIRSVL